METSLSFRVSVRFSYVSFSAGCRFPPLSCAFQYVLGPKGIVERDVNVGHMVVNVLCVGKKTKGLEALDLNNTFCLFFNVMNITVWNLIT